MHPRKHKQKLNKTRKLEINRFDSDPLDAQCPYCEKIKSPCSHVDSLSRAWARYACKRKQGR